MGSFYLRFAAIVTGLYIHATDAALQCYWPNGEPADSGYVPCNSTISGSACCGYNDACTTFGWCLGSAGMVYRGGCTDATWSSSACQTKYCFSTDTSNFQNLLSCSNGNLATSGGYNTWCCGISGSSSCCNSPFQLQVPSGQGIGLTGIAFKPDVFEPSVTVAATVTAAAASGVVYTTITTMVAATGSSSPGSSAGLSKGAVAGVSIAAAVVGAVLGVAVAFLLLRKPKGGPRFAQQQVVYMPPKPPHEIDGRQAAYEVQ